MASRIRDVWASNLEAEMHNIRELIDRYPYVALDTEFPGVVARPIGSFKVPADYHYQTMRCNVDLLKIIQLGLALSAEDGTLPGEENNSGSAAAGASTSGGDGPSADMGANGTTSNSVVAWQFNFRFDAADDMYNPEALELLHKAGLDLARHASEGIRLADFAELLITSGLVLNDDVFWISFHSAYDFGYLLRTLTAQSLPQAECDFFSLLTTWFPTLHDIKCLLRPARLRITGGLAAVADELGVRPHPAASAHSFASSSRSNASARQAGADALLATSAFHALRARAFGGPTGRIPVDYNGRLYGLGIAAVGSGADADADDAPSTSGGVGSVGTALNAVMGLGGVSATSAAAAAAAAGARAAAAAASLGLTPAERARSPPPNMGQGAGTTPQLGAAVGVGGNVGAVGNGSGMGLGGMGVGGLGLGAPTPGPGPGGYHNPNHNHTHNHNPGALGAPSPYGTMGPVGVNGAAYHLRQINVGGDR